MTTVPDFDQISFRCHSCTKCSILRNVSAFYDGYSKCREMVCGVGWWYRLYAIRMSYWSQAIAYLILSGMTVCWTVWSASIDCEIQGLLNPVEIVTICYSIRCWYCLAATLGLCSTICIPIAWLTFLCRIQPLCLRISYLRYSFRLWELQLRASRGMHSRISNYSWNEYRTSKCATSWVISCPGLWWCRSIKEKIPL